MGGPVLDLLANSWSSWLGWPMGGSSHLNELLHLSLTLRTSNCLDLDRSLFRMQAIWAQWIQAPEQHWLIDLTASKRTVEVLGTGVNLTFILILRIERRFVCLGDNLLWYFCRDNLYRIFTSSVKYLKNETLIWSGLIPVTAKKNTFSLVVKIGGQSLSDGVI